MNCKFCNAEMDEDHKFCPFCGKDQTQELPAQEPAQQTSAEETLPVEDTASVESPMEEMPAEEIPETPVEETPVEETPVDAVSPAPQKRNPWPMILGISGAVLGLIALAIALMLALGVDFKAFLPRENDVFYRETYMVQEDKAVKAGEQVVAEMGGKVLTNTQLQIYYRMQVMDLLSYFGEYIAQVNLDPTKPLSEQPCYYDETMSWEQFIIERAIETWQHYQAIGLLAEQDNFQLDEEWQASLAELPASLKAQAESGGYATVSEMLADLVGPTCTEEAYMEYVNLAYTSNAYYLSLEDQLAPTPSEVENYFAANEALFAENGITQTSGNVASVRHILLSPENPIVDEQTQETTYADEDWANCLKEAEALLEQWKKGEATEESFAALVADNTEDGGSMNNGGLYEGVGPTSSFVEPFRAWAVDITREPGDTGIVKTEFGYHIMYYVSGEPQWYTEAQVQLMSERMTEKTQGAEDNWPITINFKKIALCELNLGV